MGAIYTALGRLNGKGLVAARVEEPAGGPGRPRKLYTVEPAGARALVDAYEAVQALASGSLPGLARLAEERRG